MPNVIAPNPETGMEGVTKIVSILAKFDIQKSVERMKPRIEKLGALTTDIARELYFVKEYLKRQGGQNKDPGDEDYTPYTWGDYCEDIGFSRQAANAFLRRFTPKELSDDGEDRLLTAEEARALAPPEPALTDRETEHRIAQVMKTNERPEGWSRAEERLLVQRLDDKKLKEVTGLWMEGKLGKEPSRDFFAEVKILTHGKKRFRLKTQAQMDAQIAMFRAIHDYLSLFRDMDTLMSAAANLTDKIHTAANYFAELCVSNEDDAEDNP